MQIPNNSTPLCYSNILTIVYNESSLSTKEVGINVEMVYGKKITRIRSDIKDPGEKTTIV